MGKRKEDSLLLWGVLNFFSPFPIYMLTAFWTLLVMLLFGFNDESVATSILSALPLLLNPISCILGCVFAIKNWARCRKNAILCTVLSSAGLIGFVLLLLVMAHLSSMV